MIVNKAEVVQNMIQYIETEERDLQAARMANDSRIARTDIVNGILRELEKEMSNEN